MRQGASILEVLFAILVCTIGLLGVVAVFPVASMQAKKGRVADATGIYGRSGRAVFVTRGMNRPDQWVGWNSTTMPPQFTAIPLWPAGLPMQSWNSVCIDPRFIAAHTTPAEAGQAMYFPCYAPAGAEPRMYRITLENGAGAGMPSLMADKIFQFDDDLTVNRENDPATATDDFIYDRSANDRPAAQAFYRIDHDNDATTPMIPMQRNSAGEMSWFATLVPQVDFSTVPSLPPPRPTPRHMENPAPPMPTDYLLSIVICNQRPAGFPMDYVSERVLGVDFTEVGGVGYAGGECLLTWTAAQSAANDAIADNLLKVRGGNWVMLSGNATHAVTGTLIPRFRWYRVTDASNEWEYHTGEGHYAIAVSLSGADWDINLANQEATIVSGVTGVYEKTVRLDTY